MPDSSIANSEGKRYNIQKLRSLGNDVLTAAGLSKTEAYDVIDSMLEADLNGVSTHGIRMLPGYAARLKSGQFSTKDIEIIKQTPAFTCINANNSIGAVSAVKAITIAAEKAKETGVHMVFAKNCNTYGPAFYYVEQMARKGLVGLTSCNSPAAMPVFNGLEHLLGTNPFAFACPTKTKGNIVLDMATSVVAKSRFETARLNGEQLQPGWALDKEGKPTVDPAEAIKGFVLPMAGFKGYGMALMIDILSGMLSGAACLNQVGKFYAKDNRGMNVGQLFIAIDPTMVYDGDFFKDMDEYVNMLQSSKAVPGKQIIIPGDDRRKIRETSLKFGILLGDDAVTKLEELFGRQLEAQN